MTKEGNTEKHSGGAGESDGGDEVMVIGVEGWAL